MQNKFINIIKATIISLVVALLLAGSIAIIVNIVAGEKIRMAISLINTMSVEVKETAGNEELVLSNEKKRLERYPEYGTQYATIQIESIGVDLPVYYGDTLEILKVAVGHYSGSYFPGEGGSIVYAAHNTARFLRKLPQVKVGDIIKVKTNYGEFQYKIYETQVIHETEDEKLPIQDSQEILMIYTCYPVTGIGHKSHRFVAYAELMEEA